MNITQLQSNAEQRGGKCLSQQYLGYTVKHKWRCSRGHIWESAPQNIRQKKWCPYCVGKHRTLEDIQKLAKKLGFEIISTNFKRMSDKYKWKCKSGHTWTTTASHVIKQKTGCPYCKIFVSEEKCRFVFQSLLREKFVRTRHALGGRLELDGYCEKIKLAFEYQGIQHFSTNCFARDPVKLEHQIRSDLLKTHLCLKMGITKIDVPWQKSKTPAILEFFIEHELTKIGFRHLHDVNWNNFHGCQTALEEIQDIAKQRGFKCLSTIYWHSQSKLKFECECGWRWSARPNLIKCGTGCPKCNGQPKYTLDHLREMGDKIGLSLQEDRYHGIQHKYHWKCKHDHCWHVQGVTVKNSTKCRFCK